MIAGKDGVIIPIDVGRRSKVHLLGYLAERWPFWFSFSPFISNIIFLDLVWLWFFHFWQEDLLFLIELTCFSEFSSGVRPRFSIFVNDESSSCDFDVKLFHNLTQGFAFFEDIFHELHAFLGLSDEILWWKCVNIHVS